MKILILIFIILAIILISIGILIIKLQQKKKKRCSYRLTAVITDIKHFSNGVGDPATNHGIYEYTYQGKTYHTTSLVGSTIPPKIGKQATIYINPDKPEDCMLESWGYTLTAGILLGLGCIFVITDIVLILVL